MLGRAVSRAGGADAGPGHYHHHDHDDDDDDDNHDDDDNNNALCCYPNVKWEIRDFHLSTHFLAV